MTKNLYSTKSFHCSPLSLMELQSVVHATTSILCRIFAKQGFAYLNLHHQNESRRVLAVHVTSRIENSHLSKLL